MQIYAYLNWAMYRRVVHMTSHMTLQFERQSALYAEVLSRHVRFCMCLSARFARKRDSFQCAIGMRTMLRTCNQKQNANIEPKVWWKYDALFMNNLVCQYWPLRFQYAISSSMSPSSEDMSLTSTSDVSLDVVETSSRGTYESISLMYLQKDY